MFLKALFYFILLTFFGCTRYADYEESDGQLIFSLSSAQVQSVQHIEWEVGSRGNRRVSKGVEVRISLPQMRSDLAEKILNQYRADSWGVRIVKRSLRRTEHIGDFYVPFIARTESSRIRARSSTPKSVTFQLFYAAAAISSRLEQLECPAMGHRKMIREYRLESNSRENKIFLSSFRRNRARGQVFESGFFPVKINGGMALDGEYEIHLSFYDSQNRLYKSDMQPISNNIIIRGEQTVSLPECEGVRPPDRGQESREPFRDFKFGR